MIVIQETIGEDGAVTGCASQGERVLRYHVTGGAIQDGKDAGLDVMAEVRTVIMQEFGGDLDGLRIVVGCSED